MASTHTALRALCNILRLWSLIMLYTAASKQHTNGLVTQKCCVMHSAGGHEPGGNTHRWLVGLLPA